MMLTMKKDRKYIIRERQSGEEGGKGKREREGDERGRERGGGADRDRERWWSNRNKVGIALEVSVWPASAGDAMGIASMA